MPVPGTGRGRVPDRPDPGAPDDGAHAAHGPSQGRCGCSTSRDSSQEAGVTPSLLENRVFVVGRDGKALDPCCPKRARKLVESGRAKHAGHRPWTIQLKDRWVEDGKTVVHPHELRLDPGPRTSGIAVVMRLEGEDRVVYQEEITHRRDISERMRQRRGYRQGRRGKLWRRPARFLNRKKGHDWRAPCIESVVGNLKHRTARLAARSGAQVVRVEHAKFDLQKMKDPAIQGRSTRKGPCTEAIAVSTSRRSGDTAADTATPGTGRTHASSPWTTSSRKQTAAPTTSGTSSTPAHRATTEKTRYSWKNSSQRTRNGWRRS